MPDRAAAPSCNATRQHAVHLSSLAQQPGRIREAVKRASKGVLNNKLSESRQAPRGQLVTGQTRSTWKTPAGYFAVLLMGLERGSPATRKKANTRRLVFLSSSLTFPIRHDSGSTFPPPADIGNPVLSGTSPRLTVTSVAFLIPLVLSGVGSIPPPPQ